MSITSLPLKLFRTFTRAIPQCGMVAQAVAFNMFLAFFPILLVLLTLVRHLLGGKGGQELTARLQAILPPGSRQFVSEFLLRPEVSTRGWAILGWVAMLLVGSQVMKLIMEGIHRIYGDRERHSFAGRQLRGLGLFCSTVVVWLAAVALSVFGRQLRHWLTRSSDGSLLIHGLWAIVLQVSAMILAMLVLTFIYRVARPGPTTWGSLLPGAAGATVLWWLVNLLFGIYVRKMQYGVVYGGLAAAIGLMLWMELCATIVFLGAAWNAENTPKSP